LADPKGGLVRYNMKFRDASKDSRLGVFYTDQPKNTAEEQQYADNLAAIGFMKDRPYKLRTAFGYVTLLDPRLKIKNAVFQEEKGILHMGLNEGEILALEYLRKGCYYSTTGMPYIITFTIYFLRDKTNLEDKFIRTIEQFYIILYFMHYKG
jgi:hypothetical protein